jgi:hypothetical protein
MSKAVGASTIDAITSQNPIAHFIPIYGGKFYGTPTPEPNQKGDRL